MKIRDRLSLYFTLSCAAILLLVLGSIFVAFRQFLQDDFFKRLKDRTMVAGRLYLEADEVSADSMERIRARYLEKISGETIRIYDERDRARFIKSDQTEWPKKLIANVRRKGYTQFYDADGDRQVVGIYYKDNQGNFAIFASARDEGGMRRSENLFRIMVVTFFAVILIIFLAGRLFASRALRPIKGLIERLQLIRADHLHLRVDESGNDEISVLSRNFNSLLQHLQNAFEMQKAFIANASHELRTPVTSIIGQAEVSLRQPRNADDYRDTLQSIVQDASGLSATITELLELARADMNMSQATLSPVRVDELLWEIQDEWNARLYDGALQVHMPGLPPDPSGLILMANKALLLIALNNIIGNGFKFSDRKPVQITLTLPAGTLQVAIADEGIGIPAPEASQVFDAFFRAENASGLPGNGIGLYVSRKVIELYGGGIRISQTGTGGAVFTLIFPVSAN